MREVQAAMKLCCREVSMGLGLLITAYLAYTLVTSPLSRLLDTGDDIGDVFYSKSKVSSSRDSALKHVNCATVLCSWFEYNRSSTFSPAPKPFDIYEDQTFQLNSSEPELFCRPETFGYSIEEAGELFPFIGFPKCREKFANYRKSLFIDPITRVLTMNCTGRFKGKYVLGLSSHKDIIKLPATYTSQIRLYDGPIRLENNEEWALGTCDPDNENLFEQVEISLQADPLVLNSTKSAMESMNEQYGIPPGHRRKSLIFLLVVDSASRRHFYRKFPKTMELLKGLNENYEVTDYLIHNVIGDNSARNQIPIFTGRPRLTFRGRKAYDGSVQDLYHGDALSPNTLYDYVRELGFVSFLGFEFCHQYFAMYMGDSPEVDHLAANFWCGAREHAGFHFEKSVYGQRCVGPDMSHVHMFTYVEQFLQAYNEANQLVYTHLTAGHEATGTHIETLDDDLAAFLRGFIPRAEALGFELSILLHGDHGMRYGEWYKNIAAFQEHRLPALFTIFPRKLLKRVDSVYDVLDHNRKRLTSKLDLHLTVKSLALLNYMPEMSRYTAEYRSWKGVGFLGSSVSLILEKVANTRGCENVFIPPFYCACMKMNLIDQSIYDQNDPEYEPSHPLTLELSPLLSFLSTLSLEIANTVAYTNTASFPDDLCRKVSLDRVITIYAQKITKGDEAFKLEFSVKEHPTARFETYTVVGNTDKYVGNKEDIEAFPAAQYFFRNRVVSARVLFIKRLDKYAGICEEISFFKRISSALCVCHPISQLKSTVPVELNSVYEQFTLVQSQFPSVPCKDVCENADLKCDDFYAELLGEEQLLKDRVWSSVSGSCAQGKASGLLDTSGALECLIGWPSNATQVCEENPGEHVRALCPCH